MGKRMERGMKSSYSSLKWSNMTFDELTKKCPKIELRNKSITTSSIYCKTPDGRSLRIGDHRGKEKYSYKWNLFPGISKGFWKKEYNKITKRDHWRYYTSSVDDLIIKIEESILRLGTRNESVYL